MDVNGTVLLRVKRRHTESPIECFNTIPAKRRCLKNESTGVAHFKYLGTSSTIFETSNIALEDLEDVGASGEREIILSTKNVAHVVVTSQDAVQYEVRVSNAQCRGVKRKPDSNDEDSDIKSPPSKSIRIIDLTVKDKSAVISSALNSLKINSENIPGDVNFGDKGKQVVMTLDDVDDNDSGFVYDLYELDSDAPSDFDLSPIVYDLDSDEFDRRALGYDDDSDSNSESNWRNDYPDEDTPFAPRSSESDADSIDDSDTSDRYGFY